MLPAWLGAGAALESVLRRGEGNVLREMFEQWPFFATRIAMLEMVFAKADANLSAFYDLRLVPDALQHIGTTIREQLSADSATVLELTGADALLAGQSWIRKSIQLRNVYTDPLNVLQVELLQRQRTNKQHSSLDEAIMVTIAGLAAGMRNTG